MKTDKIKIQDSFKEYLAHPGFQSSHLKLLAESALHYKNKDLVNPNLTPKQIEKKEEETLAQLKGSATHCLAFESSDFYKRYTYLERAKLPNSDSDFRNTANKEYRTNFIAKCKEDDMYVLDEFSYGEVVGMGTALTDNENFLKLIQGGEHETSNYLWDESIQMDIKMRPDTFILKNMSLISLKTTRNASKKRFGQDYVNMGYLEKESYYRKYLGEFYGEPIKSHTVVAVENVFPYYVAIYNIGDEIHEQGLHLVETYMDRLKRAQDSGIWTGYEMHSEPGDMGIVNLEIPKYAMNTLIL